MSVYSKDYIRAVTQGKIATLKCPGSDEGYNVNKAALCRHSAFFKGYFMIDHTDTSTVEIEDVNPTVLQAYAFFFQEDTIAFGDGKSICAEHMPLLLELFIFADKYDTVRVRNTVVRLMWRLLDTTMYVKYPWPEIGSAFKRLPSTTSLYRILLIHSCEALKTSRKGAESVTMANTFPPAVLAEILDYLAYSEQDRYQFWPDLHPDEEEENDYENILDDYIEEEPKDPK